MADARAAQHFIGSANKPMVRLQPLPHGIKPEHKRRTWCVSCGSRIHAATQQITRSMIGAGGIAGAVVTHAIMDWARVFRCIDLYRIGSRGLDPAARRQTGQR